jgi:hypothetical protein
MKYCKLIGLIAIAASALVASLGASSASATQLTCTEPAGTKVFCVVGSELHSESEGVVTLHPIIGDITCERATGYGSFTSAGSSTTTPAGTPALTTLENCTAVVQVLAKGVLEIHTKSASVDNRGLVTSTGTEVTVEAYGFHCIFKTSATGIGTFTGSSITKGTPTIDLEATVPRSGGRSGAFCGSTAQMTGSLKITKPDWMDID